MRRTPRVVRTFALAAALTLLLAANAAGTRPAAWPQRLVAAESLNVSTQLVAGQAVYELVSQTLTPMHGPYLLRRRDLRTGAVRNGPRFSFANGVGNLVFASGYLWVNGARVSRRTLIQIDPRTLRVVRTINLANAHAPYPWLAVTSGPGRSVWVGTSDGLRRIDVASGKVLTAVPAPPGFAVAALAVDPAGTHLYVSTAHVVKGGLEGGAVFEYDARSGHQLAQATSGPITYSVAGASLTAVPGGVWASFRTGLLGLTIHLRRSDLALVSPPGEKIAQSPANGLFHWPMSASTIYGGGSLWIANESGVIACLDPRTAKVRAGEKIPPSEVPSFVGIDSSAKQLFVVGPTGHGVVRITPPRRCWS
jgi:ligand-binding sensor domain-containing protein